jgi:hypothetical protein
MNEILERVADALERAEVGYHLSLTRLVDGISTYTLTYEDGSPPLEFDDNSDAYAHIAAKKRLKAARLAIEAMREPPKEFEKIVYHGDYGDDVWRDSIDIILRS